MKPRSQEDWSVVLDAIEWFQQQLRAMTPEEVREWISQPTPPAQTPQTQGKCELCNGARYLPYFNGEVNPRCHACDGTGTARAPAAEQLQDAMADLAAHQVDLSKDMASVLYANRRALYIRSTDVSGVASASKCDAYVPGHNSSRCVLPSGHRGDCTDETPAQPAAEREGSDQCRCDTITRLDDEGRCLRCGCLP